MSDTKKYKPLAEDEVERIRYNLEQALKAAAGSLSQFSRIINSKENSSILSPTGIQNPVGIKKVGDDGRTHYEALKLGSKVLEGPTQKLRETLDMRPTIGAHRFMNKVG